MGVVIEFALLLSVLGNVHNNHQAENIGKFVVHSNCIDGQTGVFGVDVFGLGTEECLCQLFGDLGGVWRRTYGQSVDRHG